MKREKKPTNTAAEKPNIAGRFRPCLQPGRVAALLGRTAWLGAISPRSTDIHDPDEQTINEWNNSTFFPWRRVLARWHKSGRRALESRMILSMTQILRLAQRAGAGRKSLIHAGQEAPQGPPSGPPATGARPHGPAAPGPGARVRFPGGPPGPWRRRQGRHPRR